MNVVVACLDQLEHYVSREFHCIISDLVQRHGWRRLESGKLWQGPGTLSERLLRELGEMPHWILFWMEFSLIVEFRRELKALPARKALLVDDLHCRDENHRIWQLACFLQCDAVFPTNESPFHEIYPGVTRFTRVLWVPHSASPDFDLEFNPVAENRLLLSGAIDYHYPLRQKLLELCDSQSLPITRHQHPGYERWDQHGSDPNVGRAYAQLIHRFRTAFTDCSKHGYILAKYFEIPATGALLLGDDTVKDELRQLGFIAGTHYWPVHSANLEAQIRYVLDESNHPALDKIRRAGQQLIRGRHTTRHRADLIHQFCHS